MTLFTIKALPYNFARYCDITQRELYVGRQFAVERAAMSSLRRLGLLKRRFNTHLPPEIWAIVIGLLLDPLCAPYKYCTSETFPFYQLQMRRFGEDDIAEDDWRRVRLVCHLWNSLAGPRRISSQSWRKHPIPQGIAILRYEARYPYQVTLFHLVSTPGICARLTTLSIIERGFRKHGDQPSAVSVLLAAGSEVFPNIRSLALSPHYSNVEEDPMQFWPLLEKAFPRLISLSLNSSFHASSLDTVTLPDLEILDIPSYSYSPPLFFPSLRHLSITRVAGTDHILKHHAHQLESLLILGPTAAVIHNRKFWAQAPNLQTLGAPLKDIERMNSPPSGHPLRQICVLAAYADKQYPVRFQVLLEAFPGIRVFTFTRQTLSGWNIRSLRKLASRKGVNLVELPVLNMSKTVLWMQIFAFCYVAIIMAPLWAFRSIRRKLGFRW